MVSSLHANTCTRVRFPACPLRGTMTFDEARNLWKRIMHELEGATIRGQRVLRDPLPINTEDVLVMREQLEQVQRLLLDLRRGLEA